MGTPFCETNPVKRLLSTKDQNYGPFAFNGNRMPNTSHQVPYQVPYNGNGSSLQQQTFERDQVFLNENPQLLQFSPYSNGSNHMSLPVHQNNRTAFNGTSNNNACNSSNDAGSDWVPEFSSMQINDPLEFSQEYKKLYSNYESSKIPGKSTSNSINNQSAQFQLRNKSQLHPQMGSSSQQYNNNMQQQQHQQQHSNQNIDSYFDLEFKSVEEELSRRNEDDTLMTDQERTPMFDEEQSEFQKIAMDIIDSCTTPLSTAESTNVNSKLQRSNFFGLMR
ncbi:Pex21p NDAI_0D02610 [Naumovozyma dairenensis CBS 421]|uniref:PEX18/PEX21 C-terminal domain-containing protein n=1 Tax=Naumovozyma dairenensis (strain ATCC 10597 / BCRC 20456 / CBS 421 / NBRC 0211 / NRRL Y-12639) TaxID=1071378 RepID=G0W9W4_NAUDC|nr:hypothetical protein NDAI_0D02610 [Naumovozyma dairenensis CBS 421]CCD24575.1 hypothetical protein NDAI_0D02610 [Naumovozyma dairenensis CBS 421]